MSEISYKAKAKVLLSSAIMVATDAIPNPINSEEIILDLAKWNEILECIDSAKSTIEEHWRIER